MIEVPTRAPIDWSRIGRAVEFYVRQGFTYVETPWRVFADVVTATKPPEATPFRCRLSASRPDILVGSAEQGLLSVASTLNPDGHYVSVSPCFRDNEVDDIHFSDFMKVELMVFEPAAAPSWTSHHLLDAAQRLMYELGLVTTVADTDIGVDLVSEADGIEVGSYGWRRAVISGVERTWAYGTGLAEPRFSQALSRQHHSKENR